MLMGPHNNTVTFQFLGIDPKQPAIGGLGERSHHDIAHNPGPNQGEQKRIVDRWFVQLFADFLAKLKMRPEGSGTMLDNTLVVFVNNFSEGGSHSYTNLPFLLGGSCGGAIQTGRFVRANGWTPAKWGDNCIPHNGILVAITKAMGIAPPMMGGNEYFGDPRYGGVMPGLLA
jgi:hypothetical protein